MLLRKHTSKIITNIIRRHASTTRKTSPFLDHVAKTAQETRASIKFEQIQQDAEKVQAAVHKVQRAASITNAFFTAFSAQRKESKLQGPFWTALDVVMRHHLQHISQQDVLQQVPNNVYLKHMFRMYEAWHRYQVARYLYYAALVLLVYMFYKAFVESD